MRRFFQSLQSRLILLIILVALPGLVGLIYQSFVERGNAIDAALQQAIKTVETTTNEQNKVIKDTHIFLQRLATFSSVLNPDSPECSIVLADILKLNSHYVNLGIPRADGELLCNATPLEKPVNVADRPYIQKALATKNFSIGEFQVDRAAGVTSINFAYPVIHPVTDETVGLAVAVVSLDWWSKRLAGSRLPKNTVAYITDHEQNIIAVYPTNSDLFGANIKNVEVNLLQDSPTLKQVTKPLKSADNRLRMFVSRPLFSTNDALNITISVGIPFDEQLLVINSQLLKTGAFLVTFVILMFLIATWGIRKSVLNPLKALLLSTKNLELGKKIDNLPEQGSFELVDLQQSFALMAKTRLNSEQQLKNSQLSLQESESRLSLHIENTPLGCISWNRHFICTEWNKSAENIFGYRADEAIGRHASELIVSSELSEDINIIYSLLLEQKCGQFSSNENFTKDGKTIICEWHNTPIVTETGSVNGVTSLVQDVTEIKEYQKQLEHIAHYDVLTSLPNRTLLADRLNQALVRSKKRNERLAVVFLDLDGFKAVNDAHGHNLGDELLIALAHRLKNVLRDGDTLSRFGGDEFVAVLTDLKLGQDFEPIIEDLLKAASDTIIVADTLLKVSASIGVTLYPLDDTDADQLIRHADQAMYVAKQKGKNCYHMFDRVSDDKIKTQRESIQRISKGLENHEYVLFYQPKVNMRTGVVIGAEALIRWQHPERGLLPPLEFLPVIENNAVSIDIGEWVIDTALAQMAKWQTLGINIPVSVNVGAMQLQQKDFATRLATILIKHPDVLASNLQLEVLETSALGDVMDASQIMNNCVKLGVNFAIDDFGTGYSSLTYLRRLPVDLIKIDQTFVRDMLVDSEDLAIVVSVIGLATTFHRKVIAEGVETIAHGTALLELGCDFAQGYGIARPMPAEKLLEWTTSWQPDETWQLVQNTFSQN
jgi:diguanylate cyclase (GGDEF)-like protein/PAS domain S-box-containing protein